MALLISDFQLRFFFPVRFLSFLSFFSRCVLYVYNDLYELLNRSQDTYIGADRKIYRDLQQDCELLRIDDRSVAFKRKFDTCDPQDFNMHVSIICSPLFLKCFFL